MIKKSIRKSYCIVDEDRSWTFIKPMSGEYNRKLMVIFEDAFGLMEMKLLTSVEISHNSIMRINIDKILNILDYSQSEKEIFFA